MNYCINKLRNGPRCLGLLSQDVTGLMSLIGLRAICDLQMYAILYIISSEFNKSKKNSHYKINNIFIEKFNTNSIINNYNFFLYY